MSPSDFFCQKPGVVGKDDQTDMKKDDSQIELCPVCLEAGKEVPMIRGRPTGYYYFYRCPRCGNLALVEREKEQERHG